MKNIWICLSEKKSKNKMKNFLNNITSKVRFPIVKFNISQRYKVPNISVNELEKRIKNNNSELTIFDTRSSEEYLKSHIQNSIHVDPKTNPKKFIEKFEEKLKRMDLVFYCSVGERSSKFLKKVEKLAKDNGANLLFNLNGGIFDWYNKNKKIYNNLGETDSIHPYNDKWGLFVKKRK